MCTSGRYRCRFCIAHLFKVVFVRKRDGKVECSIRSLPLPVLYCLASFLVLADRMARMHAQTLNCPNCGAATSTDAPLCQFCESRLATVACPSCFAMMFIGSKHCPRCGTAAAVPEIAEAKDRKCPRCQSEMSLVTIGVTAVLECERCLGLWLEGAAELWPAGAVCP